MRYFNYNVELSGEIDGVNKTFILSVAPDPAISLFIILNGALQTISEDYTFSSLTITFITAPPIGSILRAFFRKNY